MRQIILTGVDLAGKDTVAELLKKELGWNILRGSSFQIAALGRVKMLAYMNSLTQEQSVIINRFAPCNVVYSAMFKDFESLTDDDVRFLEEKTKDSLYVYLFANTEDLLERLNNREEEYVKAEQFDEIKKRYEDFYVNRDCNVLSINTSYLSPEEVSQEILKVIRVGKEYGLQ